MFITYKRVSIQQGVPRGLVGPLAGCGVPPLLFLLPPPEVAQEKKGLNIYKKSSSIVSSKPV
jgi:hypothetical protein